MLSTLLSVEKDTGTTSSVFKSIEKTSPGNPSPTPPFLSIPYYPLKVRLNSSPSKTKGKFGSLGTLRSK